jgi:hypothetical protein
MQWLYELNPDEVDDDAVMNMTLNLADIGKPGRVQPDRMSPYLGPPRHLLLVSSTFHVASTVFFYDKRVQRHWHWHELS